MCITMDNMFYKLYKKVNLYFKNSKIKRVYITQR